MNEIILKIIACAVEVVNPFCIATNTNLSKHLMNLRGKSFRLSSNVFLSTHMLHSWMFSTKQIAINRSQAININQKNRQHPLR